jgi:tetratricopeptide (TPR) repeat protein
MFTLAYYGKGSLCYQLHLYKNAMYNLTKAIQINSNDSFAYYYRGKTKYELKDFRGACQDWNMAVNLGDEDASDMINKYCK